MTLPKKFGPFALSRLIGRGGMGAVYQATNETTGQTVAVKALLVPLEEERERFEAEISTLKLLRHENIVKLYGFGQEDGVLYYAMEFVPGPSLATLLKRGRRFTWEEVVYIGVSVCKALKHAHDRGVVHRDVKPANILLLDDGVVKVSDYGIAQYFGNSRLTGANQVVGTIEYMAPEQAQAGPLTPRTDVYALGALLYALLTGAPPYVARTLPELLQRYRQGSPESIRYARPEAPKILDAFLMDLLQIVPEKRPGDARLIGRRLEGILKTAATYPDGNPFWRQRFSIDGRSSTDPFSNSRVDLENPSGVAPSLDADVAEIVVEGAPDFPYRAIDDEADADASPFEKTTEIGPTSESNSDDFVIGATNAATKNESRANGDDGFELGDFSLFGESTPNDADRNVCETVARDRATFDDDGETSTLAETPTPAPNEFEVADDADFESAANDDREPPEPDATRVAPRAVDRSADDFVLSSEPNVDETIVASPTLAASAFVGDGKFSADTAAATTDDETVYQPTNVDDVLIDDKSAESNADANEDDEEEEDEYPAKATPLEKFKKSQFTPVDERELGKLPTREDERSPYLVAAQIAGAVVAFAAIFGVFWATLRTPSADALFRRIEKTIEGSDEDKMIVALRRAEDDLTRFLDVYPNDSRAEKVRYYLSELELDEFEQRIERQIQRNWRDASALPIERAYVETARIAKDDMDEGVEKLTAFVDLFESSAPVSNGVDADQRVPVSLPDQLVVVARRRLSRLEEERDQARRADLELLGDRLDAAISVRETNPERAEKMKNAIFKLYGDRVWAQEALERARNWNAETPETPPEENAETTDDANAETTPN